MTKSALYVSAFVPDRNAPHAGGQAAFQNLKDLTDLGYYVTVIVCTSERRFRKPEKHEVFITQSSSQLLLGWLSDLICRRQKITPAWVYLNTRANRKFQAELNRQISTKRFDLIFVDFTQAYLPVKRALADIESKPVISLSIPDLYVQKLLRQNNLTARLLYSSVARLEQEILAEVDEIVAHSEKDASIARHLYGCKNTRTRAFVAPEWTDRVRRDAFTPHEILFFANFQRPENIEALQWFVSDAMPKVLEKLPDFQLVIAGYGSDTVKLKNDSAHIKRIGFVEDPSQIFSNCQLAIAPLTLGAGVKYKVLEAVAAGVPVLGTDVAMEGVPDTPLLHQANRLDFTKKLIELIIKQ